MKTSNAIPQSQSTDKENRLDRALKKSAYIMLTSAAIMSLMQASVNAFPLPLFVKTLNTLGILITLTGMVLLLKNILRKRKKLKDENYIS